MWRCKGLNYLYQVSSTTFYLTNTLRSILEVTHSVVLFFISGVQSVSVGKRVGKMYGVSSWQEWKHFICLCPTPFQRGNEEKGLEFFIIFFLFSHSLSHFPQLKWHILDCLLVNCASGRESGRILHGVIRVWESELKWEVIFPRQLGLYILLNLTYGLSSAPKRIMFQTDLKTLFWEKIERAERKREKKGEVLFLLFLTELNYGM